MITTSSIQMKHAKCRTRAFTLLESLLVLLLTSFLALSLTGSVKQVFERMEETIFFMTFESLYRDSQKLSVLQQSAQTLAISEKEISTDTSRAAVPESVEVLESKKIVFDKAGGNSSLAKISFRTKQKLVTYQLYLGSGNYKKKESEGLHSP